MAMVAMRGGINRNRSNVARNSPRRKHALFNPPQHVASQMHETNQIGISIYYIYLTYSYPLLRS